MSAPPGKGEYATGDLACAAYLISIGTPFLRLWRDDRRRGSFIFAADAASMRPIVDGYFASTAPVNARAFADAHKCLKWLVHEEFSR